MKRAAGRDAARDAPASGPKQPFWSLAPDRLLAELGSTASGLPGALAAARLAAAPNLGVGRRPSRARVFLAQLRSPILWILLAAAALSSFLHDPTDAVIIVAIVLASAGLGFWQEWSASDAVARLLARVGSRSRVLRDGSPTEVATSDVVEGDVVLLSAGSTVPGDCRLLEAKDLFVVEAALTGESFPVAKDPGEAPADAPLARRSGCVFLGTHVASGTARALVVRTGVRTEFGRISERLRLRPPETEFERGVRRFGTFLAELTGLLVLALFAVNVWLERPVLEALLFSLALAVGLTPQLLPAVITVNLAHGARRMAEARVIVKRLACIENLGSMDVLCSDKTGTLTEGKVHVRSGTDAAGAPSGRLLSFATLNATLQSGFANPIDDAIRTQLSVDLTGWRKLDEVPYDFVRKRLSVLAARSGRSWLTTKGAVPQVLEACDRVELADGTTRALSELRPRLEQRYAALSAEGCRCLGVAIRELGDRSRAGREDETAMTFLGLLALDDPPKADAARAIGELRGLGVSLRVITGDNRLVAEAVVRRLGMPVPRTLTGAEITR